MRVIFTLASARSGTLFLRDLFRNNVCDCACRHEPFFDWGNPTMFGPAIYDAYAGKVDRILARLEKKKRYVERLNRGVYLESSHAFLKSAYVAALDVFPQLELIHLVRNPLLVAKSEAYREMWRRRVHPPFHFYRGEDGRRHFCWALTGNEEIFEPFAGRNLSLFQWYLLQWIEIENRAMRFLDQHQLHGRCFTLHSTRELNDAVKVKAMFDFFELDMLHANVVLGPPRNKSTGYKKVLTAEDERECDAVIERLPARYLQLFHRAPYDQADWCARWRKTEAAGPPNAPEVQPLAGR